MRMGDVLCYKRDRSTMPKEKQSTMREDGALCHEEKSCAIREGEALYYERDRDTVP